MITSDHSGVSQAQAFKSNATVGTLTGTSAGTITYAQPMLGNMILTIMKASSYKNATGTRQAITLPTVYSSGGCFAFVGGVLQTGGSSKCYFYNGGTGGTLLTVQQWGLGTGGATGGFTQITTGAPTVALYDVQGAVDTVQFDGSNTGNANGWLIMIGN